MKMYKIIPTATWKRKPAFDFFKNFDDPFFNVTVNVDVTALYRQCKKEEYSFALSVLYYSNKIMNALPEFQMRLKDGELVQYENINVSVTVLKPDNTFTFCYIKYMADWKAFLKHGNAKVAEALEDKILDGKAEVLDTVHYSVLPWLQFTSFKHARRFNTGDSIPKITIGKRFEENGRLKLPISVEVHHAIMDGFHVGQYFEKWANETFQG